MKKYFHCEIKFNIQTKIHMIFVICTIYFIIICKVLEAQPLFNKKYFSFKKWLAIKNT